MRRERGWLIVLLIVALLVAACGPEMATPTPGQKETAASSPTTGGTEVVEGPPTAALPAEPMSFADLVDADDWHILGSPDAPVTLVEYSDFQ